ncbi:MAG TPA: class I SAM-dependent methyltransferase [Candidatus Binatia bacterium]|nr:class I SAM-dependent methyltransferase [Candidatus Binatia bacterium]
MVCRICEHPSNSSFAVREMMFGFRDSFSYETCSNCGSIQICNVPAPDVLGKYYPGEFWAKSSIDAEVPAVKQFAYDVMGMLLDPRFKPIAKLVSERLPKSAFAQAARYRIKRSDRVLDAGCGTGALICALAKLGLRNPMGVDPFVENDIVYPNGARVVRSYLETLNEGLFDVIMFHHALEHVPDQVSTLKHASERLRPGGLCIVRIPTVSSEAFQTFKENWVQLDAPRHLLVPSREGIRIAAEKSGMVLEDTVDDSWSFQFWASRQYQDDIPLRDPRSYFTNPAAGLFTAAEIAAFEQHAQALNRENRGDQAIFFLRKL